MACPFIEDISSDCRSGDEKKLTYNTYLQLDTLLACTQPISNVHDEHLFIIIHQVHELWFKQIVHELDSIRKMLSDPMDASNHLLRINTQLGRIINIFELQAEQVKLMETMSPMDFNEFRGDLKSSSGYQSWQFRLIENKIGVRTENRIKYNSCNYIDSLPEEFRARAIESENEKSLFFLVNAWLEMVEVNNFGIDSFWESFILGFQNWFRDEKEDGENESNEEEKLKMLTGIEKIEKSFEEILSRDLYEVLLKENHRSLSWNALKGALMIFYKRNDAGFHGHFQILKLLMDLESSMIKWKSAHVLLVQRQIGTKLGTGGSSGYHYLRSTNSGRYRPFLDLFLLSNYLIPSQYVK